MWLWLLCILFQIFDAELNCFIDIDDECICFNDKDRIRIVPDAGLVTYKKPKRRNKGTRKKMSKCPLRKFRTPVTGHQHVSVRQTTDHSDWSLSDSCAGNSNYDYIVASANCKTKGVADKAHSPVSPIKMETPATGLSDFRDNYYLPTSIYETFFDSQDNRPKVTSFMIAGKNKIPDSVLMLYTDASSGRLNGSLYSDEQESSKVNSDRSGTPLVSDFPGSSKPASASEECDVSQSPKVNSFMIAGQKKNAPSDFKKFNDDLSEMLNKIRRDMEAKPRF